ncbi:RNA methyltransferase [candidate division KSB1 bacterium]|nr:RNA methyltransferase [candidate division KSB1 bacterium]
MKNLRKKSPLSGNQIKSFRKLKQKKFRDLEGKFIIEGTRLCREILSFPEYIECFIFTHTNKHSEAIHSFHQLVTETRIPVFYTDSQHLQSLSDTHSPQGVAAVVKKKQNMTIINANYLLALDGIQDPGNLGTILRTADWFSIDGVLLSENSVDIYNPKVVRSTMGAIFRLSVLENVPLEKTLEEKRKQGYTVIAAVITGGIDPSLLDKSSKKIFLIGNESSGISVSEKYIDIKTTIPKPGKGESLNAAIAAAILLYEFNRYQ